MNCTSLQDITFENSKESYTVAQFYEKYHENLPQIISVSQGYCGDIGLETFSMGQVLRIHTTSTQKRVVAKIQKGIGSLEGRDISIPVNYDIKFNVKGQKRGAKEQTLEDILEKHSLPVNVIPSAVGTLQFGDKERTVGLTCELKLTKTYDDRYLLGNAVSDGMLYARMTAVPVYLPDLRLSVATGIKNFTADQWLACKKNMDELVRSNVKFEDDFGNPNIAVYSDVKPGKADSDYEFTYRVPIEYYNMEDILQHQLNRQSQPIYTVLSDQTYAFIPADYEPVNVRRSSKAPPPILPKPTPKDGEEKAPPIPMRKSIVEITPLKKEVPEVQVRVQEDDENSNASGQSLGSDTSRHLDVSKLNINELSYWMRELKLERYIPKFEDDMMDGTLLCECEKSDLVSSFNMTSFEAIKLLKFAKTGHVPQRNKDQNT